MKLPCVTLVKERAYVCVLSVLFVGEVRGAEPRSIILQAMNTGHDGSLTTVHANNARDAIARLETLTMMAGMDLPLMVIRSQIASAIHLIVQQARLKDGSRKITQITEVQGMEGEFVTLQNVFLYLQPGEKAIQPSQEGGGTLTPTGLRPKFASRFDDAGIKLPPDTFGSSSMFSS